MGRLLANIVGKTYPNQSVTKLPAQSMEYSNRFVCLQGLLIHLLYPLLILRKISSNLTDKLGSTPWIADHF